jgi:hypothetical protein
MLQFYITNSNVRSLWKLHEDSQGGGKRRAHKAYVISLTNIFCLILEVNQVYFISFNEELQTRFLEK